VRSGGFREGLCTGYDQPGGIQEISPGSPDLGDLQVSVRNPQNRSSGLAVKRRLGCDLAADRFGIFRALNRSYNNLAMREWSAQKI